MLPGLPASPTIKASTPPTPPYIQVSSMSLAFPLHVQSHEVYTEPAFMSTTVHSCSHLGGSAAPSFPAHPARMTVLPALRHSQLHLPSLLPSAYP